MRDKGDTMKKPVQKEVKQLIKTLKLNCKIAEFKDKANWFNISCYQKLSEDFIREFKDKVYWDYISSSQKLPEDFIREFKDKVDWINISCYQKLSEDFIREFKDKVSWNDISSYQKLSEDFIREFKDKVDWDNISSYQKLSEDFIREFKDKVYWYYISSDQKLSEDFIREFKDRVDWYSISRYQKLSEDFIREFKDKVNAEVQRANHKEKTLEEKTSEIKEYARENKLKFDGKFLYAFRDHDRNGCGMFNKTFSYEKGKYYSDWHCDMNAANKNSFGLGIFPNGNTKVKVSIKDWGVSVSREDGKARVWGFKVI
jgi:hypothetical protein